MALSKIDPVTSVDLADTEYFLVNLTTAQTGLTDNTLVVVDFGGKGTVVQDTKSNFDTSNDAYEFASSDGVYMISYSVGVRSDTVTAQKIVESGAVVEFSADNFSIALNLTFPEVVNTFNIEDNVDDLMAGPTSSGLETARCTRLTVVRIA